MGVRERVERQRGSEGGGDTVLYNSLCVGGVGGLGRFSLQGWRRC